jgi:hypothetical protein
MSNSPVTDIVGKAKAWWQSKTFIGIIIMIINPALKLFGIDLDVGDVADTVFTEAEGIAAQADSIWGMVVTAVGALVAAWGRITAKVGIKGAAQYGPIKGGGSNPGN